LEARLTTFLCNEITVAKPEEVKTGWFSSKQFWQNLLRKDMPQKGCFATNDDDDDDDDDTCDQFILMPENGTVTPLTRKAFELHFGSRFGKEVQTGLLAFVVERAVNVRTCASCCTHGLQRTEEP
jgi:hypothetical protein